MDELAGQIGREARIACRLAATLAGAWSVPSKDATLDVDGVALTFVTDVRLDTAHARHSGWPDCQRWLEARRACAPLGRLAIRLGMPRSATPDHPLLLALRARGVPVVSQALHVTTDAPERFAEVLAIADVLHRLQPYVALSVSEGGVVATRTFWVGAGHGHQIASESDARNVVALAREVADAIDRVARGPREP